MTIVTNSSSPNFFSKETLEYLGSLENKEEEEGNKKESSSTYSTSSLSSTSLVEEEDLFIDY